MASIFTYAHEPARVASPWLQAAACASHARIDPPPDDGAGAGGAAGAPEGWSASGGKVTRLRAEPQEGPVEYKMHLLFRPRRRFTSTSTGNHASAAKHSHQATSTELPAPASAPHARQHRLEQLTTQLLWRLQQSAPHHTSSATNVVLPSLPEALPELRAPPRPAKLLHGLEESQGALYEIGVSDDGALVGLAEDEMDQSIDNLRAMAACLGCAVDVLRREVVGECEWWDDTLMGGTRRLTRRSGKLVVVEALVRPCLHPAAPLPAGRERVDSGGLHPLLPAGTAELAPPSTDQLRITLTGPTMSGKSSLLGTLTTSTLDNGRGKSRLSMLRHHHEITSGVTSSVAHELLGYRDSSGGGVEVVNYATENVASWIDIHDASAGNRLALISDSAGHPRYRRTTVRGLVGWAPHWTLLCIPADDAEDAHGNTGGPLAVRHMPLPSDMDLSGAQLDLCLRLELPLVVVITKLDLASRAGLKQSLTKVLDALKAAGRKPAMLSNKPGFVTEDHPQKVGDMALDAACRVAVSLVRDCRSTVPIVLTSAVDGTGIANLHALLHQLPIADGVADPSAEKAPTIYDIEDIYTQPADAEGVIVSGRLREGRVSVGDVVVLGPVSSSDDHHEGSEDFDERSLRRASSQLPQPRSCAGAMRESRSQRPSQEWRRVRIVSIRNLRLPVHTLHADQIGTLAITPASSHDATSSALHRIRKGMILAAVPPLAARTFTAQFQRHDVESLGVGNYVIVYISSVRASARVVSARAPDPAQAHEPSPSASAEPRSCCAWDEVAAISSRAKVAGTATPPALFSVTFSLDACKQYIMLGDRALVMPGGGHGHFGGLEGFVGTVTDVRA